MVYLRKCQEAELHISISYSPYPDGDIKIDSPEYAKSSCFFI